MVIVAVVVTLLPSVVVILIVALPPVLQLNMPSALMDIIFSLPSATVNRNVL